ncbi:MAG: glycosyltransferase [Candidatus Hydrothermarchaeota archaeon]
MLIICLLSILTLFYGAYCVFGFLFGKKIYYKIDDTYLPRVSLVIPTYNEEKTIKKKIQNLINLSYPQEKLEVIFVDSSTDKTRETIKEFSEESTLNIILIEENERRGLASALNVGYATASGEIVIKTDCDMLLERSFVERIVKYFSEPNIGAVSGAIKVSSPSNHEIGYRTIFEKLRIAEANLDSTYLFNGFAFRRSLLEHIDERSVADDAELALKIRKKGYKTVYAPDAIIYEHSPVFIKDRVRIKSRRAQGYIRLMCQNMDVLFNPRYGKFGLVIFPANFFMVVISPWLMLLTFFLSFIYLYKLLGLFSLLLTFGFLALILVVYTKSKPRIVAGFLDAQLNLIIGFLNLITKGPYFKWDKR